MILDERQMTFLGADHRRACLRVVEQYPHAHKMEPFVRDRYYVSVNNLIPPELRQEVVEWLHEREIDYQLMLCEIIFANPNDEMEFKLRWG